MGKYNWKDKYFDIENVDVSSSYNVYYLSTLSPSGDGSRRNPYSISQKHQKGGARDALILSHGMINRTIFIGASSYYTPNVMFIGSGIKDTIFSDCIIDRSQSNLGGGTWIFKDLKVDGLSVSSIFNGMTATFKYCDISSLSLPSSTIFIGNCLIRTNFYSGLNNSYVGVTDKTLPNANFNLFDKCKVLITSSDVTSFRSNFLAFNDCEFRIGTETIYKPLIGTSEVELRDDFVRRCEKEHIAVTDVSHLGETLKQGKWVFSNDSCVDGLVLKDSVIHHFEKRKLIYFGYSDFRGDNISITSDTTKASSFSPANVQNVNVKDNSISLLPSVDISKTNTGIVNSNIISFGVKQKLNKLDVLHNLPKEYGVFLDSTPILSATPTTTIEAAKVYYVRSKNENEATVTYKGIVYSSSLLKANNVFIGVDGYSSLDASSQDAVIYEVLDQVMHQTIQMRIVNKIPLAKITAGTALSDGYWYLVEHDTDQSNTADYATYGGSNYKVGSSFLAKGTASFTKSGNVHLRRCWKDSFNFETDADKEFWRYEQKPQWFDVLPDDLRCLMKNNNGSENEMQTDSSGSYIASGHDLFYNKAIGVNGIKLPTYPVQGAYMQLRLVISTANPM